MSPFIHFISWTMSIGNRGAAANAWRAIDERVQAEAALDALSVRMNGPASSADGASSRAA
jgi:hypothetical protein